MKEKSQEAHGSKGSSDPQEIFWCPQCESENAFPGHKGETVTCSTCGATMKRKIGAGQPEEDFFVCPECDSELEAPGHKGEPVMCPTCSVPMQEKHRAKGACKSC
jgi:exosome complex RNA-binding protein Csl4